MKKILVVEDDIYLREELVHCLKKEGYSVLSISSFHEPVQEILEAEPDLVVLDINLPGASGYALCKSLKSKASFPILILTSRDALSDELKALDIGADDFLTKPCPPQRLIARIESLLRLYEKVGNILQINDLTLDTDTYRVGYGHNYTFLSETEGKILNILMDAYPEIVSKEDLFRALWGGELFVDENILQVNISRLRNGLQLVDGRDLIQNIRGKGYRLEV